MNNSFFEVSKVGNVAYELHPLSHVFVIVLEHIILNSIVKDRKCFSDVFNVLFRYCLENAYVTSYNAAGTLKICEKANFTKEVKKSEKLHDCYIRGVTANVHAVAKFSNSDDPRPGVEFSIVSPLGNGVAEDDGLHNIKPKNLPPFWAVLLAARKRGSYSNMSAHTYILKGQEPRIQNKQNELAGWSVNLEIHVPFLTNNEKIKEGELLVLPMDGGARLLLKDAVAKHTESWLPAKPLYTDQ